MAIWPKAIGGAGSAPLDSVRYVVLDTELTSLEQRTNRLLSVGAIAMQGASIQLGQQFYRVVNPQVEIPAESVVIHQIRAQDVEDASQIAKTLEELGQFIAGAVLVGHFASIDVNVLRKEMAQTGHTLTNPAVCTARTHQWLLRKGPYSEDLQQRLERLDLATVATYYGLAPSAAHHALSDAFLTASVWQKMLFALPKHGVKDVKKLLKIAAV